MKYDPKQLLEKVLRENNYSVTAARQRVFQLLLGQEPQFMHQLLARAGDTVDRVSIYRTIELYERLGIVHRIPIGWKYKLELSDIFLAHHHHISCLACGKVTAIKEDESLERLIEKMSAAAHFRLQAHQLELQGYCQNCQEK